MWNFIDRLKYIDTKIAWVHYKESINKHHLRKQHVHGNISRDCRVRIRKKQILDIVSVPPILR